MNRSVLVVLAMAPLSWAHAEHDHASHPSGADRDGAGHVTATVGAIAASYRSRLFEGSYQGAIAGLRYARDRFDVGATMTMYRIDRNGRMGRGLGDLIVHGNASLIERGAIRGGAHVMVMLPTGDEVLGLGMGHIMLMPAVWFSWSPRTALVSAMIGYARGTGGNDAHAEHGGGGAWPLVEPMSVSEVTFDVTAMLVLADGLRAGSHVLGGMPTGGEPARVGGGLRVSWREGPVETTAEIQAGLVGDPFGLRGVLSTSLRF